MPLVSGIPSASRALKGILGLRNVLREGGLGGRRRNEAQTATFNLLSIFNMQLYPSGCCCCWFVFLNKLFSL